MEDQKPTNKIVYDATTKEFAKINGIQAQSLLVRFYRHGSYFGVEPLKLANGRLMWPSVPVAKNGGGK